MNVYVARHGETDWNREGRYQGQCESHLTATGRAQADALAEALSVCGIERIVSSPLARCRDTASPLALVTGCAVEVDARLIEIAHGDWEGRLREEIERDDAARMRAWREEPDTVHFSGGESLEQVMERWHAFARGIDGNTDVAVITHDVLVRLALLDATNRPLSRFWEPRVVNGGYARFTIENGEWRVLDECVDAHLGDLLVDTERQAL
jgi:probable phosphoglycerate mutase